MRSRILRRRFVAVALAASMLAPAGLREARACGIFASSAESESALARRLPYLSIERVLIVWDRETETEDFIREARFDQADRSFGFVVPVPSRPEVFPVDPPPFEILADKFPFRASIQRSIGTIGHGAGGEPVPARVEVLSTQRIGSFTAFVLAANEGGGLEQWLRDNGFRAPDAARPWLDHYVRLRFYYVALRYDPPASGDKTAQMISQTLRIRFKTPIAYYPYLEPEPAKAEPTTASRLLEVWCASQDVVIPTASRSDGQFSWQRPWDGSPHPPIGNLRAMLPSLAAVLPEASLYVTPFRDAKVSRAGWGDVLLLPVRVGPVNDDTIAKRWPLMGVLDPRLEAHIHDPPLPASAVFPALNENVDAHPVDSHAENLPVSAAGSCGVGRATGTAANGGALAMLALLASLAAFRRSRTPADAFRGSSSRSAPPSCRLNYLQEP